MLWVGEYLDPTRRSGRSTWKPRTTGACRRLPLGFPKRGATFGPEQKGALANLQTLPDSGLRFLAGVSIGIGAGLRLSGRKRLAALVGLVPASIFGFAIMSRPQPTSLDTKPARP